MNPLQILILDFGSQYTQLIARRIRELHIYCEIHPFHHIPSPDALKGLKGIILSGSPCSVRDADAPTVALEQWIGKLPILGICYGAQLMAQQLGGLVMASENREYGRAYLKNTSASALLSGIEGESQVWMSHADTIQQLPQGAKILATTESIPVAAYQLEGSATYGIQFHPEVTHTTEGKTLFKNFVIDICGAVPNWTPASFIEQSVQQIQSEVGSQEKVVLGLSGGVDSSVAALLLHKAIGTRLYCIFVDSGLLRKNEYEEVLHSYQDLGLNVIGVNAKDVFFEALQSLNDPEAKRKAIGKTFIEVFDREAHQISDVKWLAQGTIYPDVIESVSVKGPSVTIKSHHNVGGLPEKMNLKVIEPLRSLFKDEVREVGKALGLPTPILHRHPFPGPGLAIRIIGDITPQKVAILQEADHIYIQNLRESGWYDKIWQAGAILLNTQSVGVMGDERTYENVVALRAVTSTDGMTADWVHIPYELLAKISNEIINRVKGVNRVVYDISSKPPATIEWE